MNNDNDDSIMEDNTSYDMQKLEWEASEGQMPLDARMEIRVSYVDKWNIHEAAKLAEMSVSAFIRNVMSRASMDIISNI